MDNISIQINDDAFLQDQIIALLHRESRYISSSTIAKNHQPPRKYIHNRGKIITWLYDAVNYFQFDREVVPICMDYLDRFLLSNSTTKDISTRIYKLVAMTSLYLAVKLNIGNISPKRNMCLQEYASFSEGLFSPENISSMERCILDTLKWRVNPVSPMCFVRYFLKLVEPMRTIEVMNDPSSDITSQDRKYERMIMDLCMDVLNRIAVYFTELAICMPETTAYFHLTRGKDCSIESFTFTPSTIAYASILLSMDMISYSALPLGIRESFLSKCTQFCTDTHYSLRPDRKDIRELQVRIKKNFTLDTFLSQVFAEDGRAYRCASESYPLTTAIRYGILNTRFLDGISISCSTNSAETLYYRESNYSQTSPRIKTSYKLSNRITYRASPCIPVFTAKRKPIICEDDHSSPTSSMYKDVSSCNLPAKKTDEIRTHRHRIRH